MNILDILRQNWNPKIGDPTFMGWLTVVAYFLAAILLFRNWQKASAIYTDHLKSHRRVILAFALVMIGLGINKQLDLQTWLTKVGRDVSKAQGWWENRRVAQAIVLAVIVVSGVSLGAVTLRARGVVQRHRLALLGFLFLVTFVVTRASSFFQMDRLINAEILGFRLNWLLELTGIGIIAASAWRNLRRVKPDESD